MFCCNSDADHQTFTMSILSSLKNLNDMSNEQLWSRLGYKLFRRNKLTLKRHNPPSDAVKWICQKYHNHRIRTNNSG